MGVPGEFAKRCLVSRMLSSDELNAEEYTDRQGTPSLDELVGDNIGLLPDRELVSKSYSSCGSLEGSGEVEGDVRGEICSRLKSLTIMSGLRDSERGKLNPRLGRSDNFANSLSCSYVFNS